jgi:hypothetical protein
VVLLSMFQEGGQLAKTFQPPKYGESRCVQEHK